LSVGMIAMFSREKGWGAWPRQTLSIQRLKPSATKRGSGSPKPLYPIPRSNLYALLIVSDSSA
ncbi:MAG: hypothetical protein LBC41_07220, partial [Clostridiales bacterium]|nr:hypothetical protein [Clostridiales bacterium]